MNIIKELRDFDDPYLNRLANRLEASGALVPVPYGWPCARRKCTTRFFQWSGKIYRTDGKYMPSSVVTDEPDSEMQWNVIVQPVRMVPIKEAQI